MEKEKKVYRGWPDCPFQWQYLESQKVRRWLILGLFPGGGGGLNSNNHLRAKIYGAAYGIPFHHREFRRFERVCAAMHLDFLRLLFEHGALATEHIPEWARTAKGLTDAYNTTPRPVLTLQNTTLEDVLHRLQRFNHRADADDFYFEVSDLEGAVMLHRIAFASARHSSRLPVT